MIWVLVLLIAGHPERPVETCHTYRVCSDEGQRMAAEYIIANHVTPDAVSYRVQRLEWHGL